MTHTPELQAIDIERYLPQRRPMRMVSELLEYADQRIRCRCRIEADNPLLEAGVFPVRGGHPWLGAGSLLYLGGGGDRQDPSYFRRLNGWESEGNGDSKGGRRAGARRSFISPQRGGYSGGSGD